MRGSLATLILMTSVTLPTTGFAEEVARTGDQYRNYPFAIEGQLSPFGGPLGMAGVAVDVAVLPELSIASGIGAGGFAVQWGAALKPRIPVNRWGAVSFTLGYSHGDYKKFRLDIAEGLDGAYLFRDASWLNADIGFEFRFASHFLLRPYIGLSQLVASKAPVWHESDRIDPERMPFSEVASRGSRWPSLFYTGIAIGFDIGKP
jgi:hypothetical protein